MGMTVGDLKKLIRKLPNDMEIVNGRYSDYQLVQADEWSVIQGVERDCWVMRAHPTMSDIDKANMKSYLYLAGN